MHDWVDTAECVLTGELFEVRQLTIGKKDCLLEYSVHVGMIHERVRAVCMYICLVIGRYGGGWPFHQLNIPTKSIGGQLKHGLLIGLGL
jgi:hypothetical protein